MEGCFPGSVLTNFGKGRQEGRKVAQCYENEGICFGGEMKAGEWFGVPYRSK